MSCARGKKRVEARNRDREQAGGTGDRRLAKFHVRSVGSPAKIRRAAMRTSLVKGQLDAKQMRIRHLVGIDGENLRVGG